MAEMDDFLERLSKEMQEREIRDLKEEIGWRMQEFEATTKRLQVLFVLGVMFLPYLNGEGNVFELEDVREAYDPVPSSEEGVQSYRVKTLAMQVDIASAFKHIERLGRTEGVETPVDVTRQADPSLPSNQVYVLMRNNFDPAALTIRGLLETSHSGQNTSVERVLRLDLLPPFHGAQVGPTRRK